ncbi:hypothetical protein HNY73_010914 [Argiope bruennichi]|uniref:Uncharacterized protein n=1 Tax=Argiope bruennichi TaxID=94029 RepID=A0A8T0F4K1_ARGBR|nr:hypothetical protein HNY73_010914 [Argiope bruennichi]
MTQQEAPFIALRYRLRSTSNELIEADKAKDPATCWVPDPLFLIRIVRLMDNEMGKGSIGNVQLLPDVILTPVIQLRGFHSQLVLTTC